MPRKALVLLLFLLVLIPTCVAQQTKATGRVASGTLATRPTCPSPAVSGDEYVAVDQNPVAVFLCDSANGWQFLSYVPTLPNQNLAFSANPNFPVIKTNVNYTMTLTGNVASSTTTGTPLNGTLMGLTLIQDGTGGWTFAFPANFVLPVAFSFDVTALHTNALVFRYDGTNWQLFMNAGGGGTGSPAGNNGDVQMKSGAAFAASGMNDNGTRVNISRDVHGTGPNPWIDITNFGARATPFNSMPQTTCTTTGGSTTMIVGSGASFVNGDGIVCRGAGATTTIGTPAAPTVVPSSAIGPTGTGQDAAAPAGALTNQYCVVAVDIGGGMSPCSPVTSTATANTLGAQSVGVTSWTAGGFSSGSTITVTTSAPHTMVVGTYIQFSNINDGSVNGFWKVATVPDNTHFTFQTSNMVALGLPTSGGSGATVYYWNSNHITWTEVPNAVKYYVYGRTAGSMALIGVTTLQISTMCNSCISGSNPGPPSLIANMFDDYGASMTQNISNNNVPDYVPVSPPVAAKNKDFVTTIVSGAGTTTLITSAAATNAVTGATMKIDNSININLAMNAATLNGSATQGVVFIPATGAQGKQFETNSPLQMYSGSLGTISFIQAGQLNLGDMLWTQGGTSAFGTQVLWQGFPTNPNTGRGSFTRSAGPTITSSRATPMIYSANKNWRWSNVVISNGQPNQGYTWISDDGGTIPGSTWDNIVLSSSGANDTMIIGFLMRGDSNGGADFQFNHFSVTSGPGSQAPGVTTTPAFYGDGMPSPIVISDMFLSLRTMYFRMLPQGLQLTIEKIYDEGGIEPMVGVFFTGGSAALNLEMRGVVADTMGAPMFSYFGSISGNAKIVAWTGVGSAQPFSNGPPNSVSVVGAGPPFAYGTATASGNPSVSQAQDGVMNPSMGPYALTNANSSYVVPNVMQHFVQGGITTPACAISAGGTAPIQQWAFRIAPVFRNGSTLAEGAYGNTVFCSTTSGQQTATVTWTPIPGAVGYDFAENNNVVNCNPNNQGGSATSYVRNNANPTCGFTTGVAGGGVTSMGSGGLSAQALRLNNNFTTTVQPSAVAANRTQTLPDATGTVLLDTTTTTSAGLAPSPFDNFFRANGALGSNWTADFTANGTLAIVSNAVPSANATSVYTGSHWSGTPFLNDNYAEATLASVPAGSNRVGIGLRMNSGNNGYECGQGPTLLFVERILAGGAAFVTNVGHTAAIGDRVRAQIVGNVFTCSVTSPAGVTTSIAPQTVTDFATGSPGIVFFQGTAGTLTNFVAGSIPNNTAYATSTYGDQQLNGDQHIRNGALTVEYHPGPTTGGLATGIYDGTATPSLPLCTDANKKYTTACTGLFTIPFKPFIGAALCNNATAGPSMNLPTAAAPTVNCRTGTNVQEGTLDFADGDSAQFSYILPSDWTGAIDARALFFSPDVTGTVIWNIATACNAINGSATDDTVFNTASAFGTITLGAGANNQWAATVTGITTTSCVAGSGVTFKVTRAADSATSRARLKGIELTVRRAI